MSADGSREGSWPRPMTKYPASTANKASGRKNSSRRKVAALRRAPARSASAPCGGGAGRGHRKAAPLRGVLGAGEGWRPLEGEGVPGDIVAVPGAPRLAPLDRPGGGGAAYDETRHAEMRDRHAIGGARQRAGPPPT